MTLGKYATESVKLPLVYQSGTNIASPEESGPVLNLSQSNQKSVTKHHFEIKRKHMQTEEL